MVQKRSSAPFEKASRTGKLQSLLENLRREQQGMPSDLQALKDRCAHQGLLLGLVSPSGGRFLQRFFKKTAKL